MSALVVQRLFTLTERLVHDGFTAYHATIRCPINTGERLHVLIQTTGLHLNDSLPVGVIEPPIFALVSGEVMAEPHWSIDHDIHITSDQFVIQDAAVSPAPPTFDMTGRVHKYLIGESSRALIELKHLHKQGWVIA